MIERDVLEKLRSLTKRQKEVLKRVCEGTEYKAIGKELFLSENTIKTHMGNVYIKLGLTHLPPTLRKKILLEAYCPAIQKLDYPLSVIHQDEPEDSDELEPVPDEVIEMVEKDELALMVIEPEIIDIPPFEDEQTRSKKDEKERKQLEKGDGKDGKRFWCWVMFIIIIALLVFGGLQIYSWARGFLNDEVVPMIAQNTPETVPAEDQAQPTIQPTRIPTKEAVIITTNTELPPTPVPTRTPSPRISLPFFDDFSNGINSPWSVGSGNWLVTDSGASISISDVYDDDGSIVLDDPTLTDYKLRVKVHTPSMWAANQGQFGVIVRYSSNRDQNIIFYMNSNGRFKWAFTESLSELPFYLPDVTGVDKDAGSTDVTLEIEVIGNTFIARVDGAKVDQFSMPGYENGGIALVTACGNVGRCPSFSDLSIEPIN